MEQTEMHHALKKSAMAVLAVATIAAATFSATSSAEARRGWVGPAIVGGIALGAIAAASAPRYGYAYGYGPGYYDCERRVVGYTHYGRPIVRRVCY